MFTLIRLQILLLRIGSTDVAYAADVVVNVPAICCTHTRYPFSQFWWSLFRSQQHSLFGRFERTCTYCQAGERGEGGGHQIGLFYLFTAIIHIQPRSISSKSDDDTQKIGSEEFSSLSSSQMWFVFFLKIIYSTVFRNVLLMFGEHTSLFCSVLQYLHGETIYIQRQSGVSHCEN